MYANDIHQILPESSRQKETSNLPSTMYKERVHHQIYPFWIIQPRKVYMYMYIYIYIYI